MGHPWTTLWAKNSLLKVAKIEIFSLLYRIPLYYPVSQKFAQNRSVFYGFGDIFNFLFFAKIQDGHQNFRILNFFVFTQDNQAIIHLQSYQSQMQYQASYRHNNLVFQILVKYLESFSLYARKPIGTENTYT